MNDPIGHIRKTDPRAVRFAQYIGGQVVPRHYQVFDRKTISWTPAHAPSGEVFRIEHGDWVGEFGRGAENIESIRINLISRLREFNQLQRMRGNVSNVKKLGLAAIRCNMVWIFDHLDDRTGDPEKYAQWKKIQDDTLEAILLANGIGYRHVPKQHVGNINRLKAAGTFIAAEAFSSIEKFFDADGRDDKGPVLQEARTVVTSHDEDGYIIDRQEREEQLCEDGAKLVGLKSDGF